MSRVVDVVILSWNRADDTIDTLQSVIGQKEVSPRVWLVDQGSSPDQLERLQAFAGQHSEVDLTKLGRNVGVPAGRNIGIRRGTADVVVSLDNDAVLLHPSALAAVLTRFDADAVLGALAFRAEDYFTGELDETSWAFPPSLRDAEDSTQVARFVGVGHALRRSAFDVVGGYDDDLFFCEEELDLSWRMIEAGYNIVYDPSIVVRHKVSTERRVRWDANRVYYQTRNAVLIHHRHLRSLPTTLLTAGGWLARAAYNREAGQAWRGVRDARRMWRGATVQSKPLGSAARRYIHQHDTRLRGPLWTRVRREVLAALPGRSER